MYSVHNRDMNIQEYLDWKDMKWKELADKLGVSEAYMSRLRHGKINWSPEMALRIEKITDKHVSKETLVWPS